MSSTNRKRAARKIARERGITYMQALDLVLAGEQADAAAASTEAAAIAAAVPAAQTAPAATDSAAGEAAVVCVNCGMPIETSAVGGWSHAQVGGRSGGRWCNPDYTPGNAHTVAEPPTGTRVGDVPDVIAVTAVYDYATVTVTVPFPTFDPAAADHDDDLGIDTAQVEADVMDALANLGITDAPNDLAVDGDTFEDGLLDAVRTALINRHRPDVHEGAGVQPPTGTGGCASAVSGDGMVTVEWVDLGEGLSGDYDLDDPTDVPLLRFDTLVRVTDRTRALLDLDIDPDGTGEWGVPADGSYCTQVPAGTDPVVLTALAQAIADRLADNLGSGGFTRTAEELSWVGPDDIARIGTRTNPAPVPLTALRPGALVDLSGDVYADPTGDNPTLDGEYVTVVSWFTAPDTGDVVVGFDGIGDVVFPATHTLPVVEAPSAGSWFTVGDTGGPGGRPVRLAAFLDEDNAARYIDALPGADTGRYYLDPSVSEDG